MWTLVTLIFCLLYPASAGDIALHIRAVNEPSRSFTVQVLVGAYSMEKAIVEAFFRHFKTKQRVVYIYAISAAGWAATTG